MVNLIFKQFLIPLFSFDLLGSPTCVTTVSREMILRVKSPELLMYVIWLEWEIIRKGKLNQNNIDNPDC